MDGIEIITKEIINESNNLIFYIVVGLFITLLFASILYYLITYNEKVTYILAFVIGSALPLFIITGVLSCTVFATPTDRYKYTAKIDESVSLVEFYDNYTNIEYKNGIWYFEDKK